MRAHSGPTQLGRALRPVAVAVVTCCLVVAMAGPAIARQATPGASDRYTVRRGDTLSAIARRTGHSVASIARANSISDPNLIVAGRRLTLPAGPAAAPTRSVAQARAPQIASHPSASRWSPAVTTGGRRHPSALTGSRLRLMGVFEYWAGRYGMRSDLLKALCYLESGWQSHAVSSTGAVGIGQLMPATAAFMRELIGQPLARTNPYDNIHMSAKYLRWLLDQTGWNVRTAVGSYYQGLQAMRAHGPFAGTAAYVNAVLALQARF